MSMAITMESNAVDTAIESAAAVAASLHRVVVEMHESAKSYIAEQQAIATLKQSVAERLSQQHKRLKNIEHDTSDIEQKLKKATKIKTNDVAHEVSVKLSSDNLLQGVLGLQRDYRSFKLLLRTNKVISITSFSIKWVMDKIFKSLDRTERNAKYINTVISGINNYSAQECAAYQTSQLAGIAAMNGEVVKLHPADIGFILESQEAPTRTPTPAMQRALKRFAQCSMA